MSKKAFSVVLTAIILSLFLSHPQEVQARAKLDRSEMSQMTSLGRLADPPFVSMGCHNVGKISMSVTNQGTFGNGFAAVLECPDGSPAPSTIYPINSGVDYLFAGAFWIGAIIGRDTLVSVGADGWSAVQEMWPASLEDQVAHGEELKVRSISDPSDPEFALALSEQDITFAYFDTLTEGVQPDRFDNLPHDPLGVKIRQTSYAWSYSYAEDFVLFDFKITNIGRNRLEKVYMGIYVDGDVGHPDEMNIFTDDICGFKLSVDQLQFENTQCQFVDTIRIAWLADNDGNNQSVDLPPTSLKDKFTPEDPVAVVGTRVVRTPSDSLTFSFNWWVSNGNAALDFGPRLKDSDSDPFRDFGGFLGTPEGDKNKYYIMRHEEFDYDQLFSAVDSNTNWLPPASQAGDISDGFDTRYLLSFGPFTIFPGEELPITFAYVAGDNFHVHPLNKSNLFSPLNPDAFASSLDFTDLGINAQWASWIYDNPGVDTDGDGFRGKARVCVNDSTAIDTSYDTFFAEDGVTIDSIVIRDIFFTDVDSIFYEGDGVPDFLGASPPPAPIVRLEPSPGRITVRWNGLRSETTPDPFSLNLDFEGYRVYVGLGNRVTDMTLESSYDRENYTRFFWNESTQLWKVAGTPQTLIEVQDLYVNKNRSYDPIFNGIDNPLIVGDSLFYFITQDWNRGDLSDTSEIFKPIKYRYNLNPDSSIMLDTLRNPDGSIKLDSFGQPVTVKSETPFPHNLFIDSAFTADTFLVNSATGDTTWYIGGELTEDGKHFKYFEYAYQLKGLLASRTYFVSVTAFDFGAPASGLDALETSPLFNLVSELPQNQTSVIEAQNLGVIVYPNPYRIDGLYRESGFEARINPLNLNAERTRAVNFTNLPAKCTIRIFTLDGDLVTEIVHDEVPDSPGSMHAIWSLVTRNNQAAASGIYYWSVEEPGGRVQTGKLVLIM